MDTLRIFKVEEPTNIKEETIDEEEEKYVACHQQCKEEEIPTSISTAMSSEISEQEFWTGFLNMYRSHECLWKVTCKEYTNEEIKAKAYQQLIDYCKDRHNQADLPWVKKKIQNFRTVFLKEHKRVKESQRSGTGADEVQRPTLWYYSLLLFTLDDDPQMPSTCSMMAPTEGTQVDTRGSDELPVPSEPEVDGAIVEHAKLDVSDVEPSSPPWARSPPARRRRVAVRTSSSGLTRTERFLTLAEQIIQNPPGENQIFGMNIGYELDRLDSVQAERFKTIVLDALVCARRGILPERPILLS